MERKIKNIGILAHVDAGKTTVTEQLLYLCGAIRSPGSVDEGTTQTDWLDVEKARGISVKASAAHFTFRDYEINLIDTPGHVDFMGEVERSLCVLDGAILVISAAEGVQAQTVLLWKALRTLGIPALLLVNKIDRVGSRCGAVLGQIQKELTDRILVTQTVAGEGTQACRVDAQAFDDKTYYEETMLLAAEADPALEARFLAGESVEPQALEAALSLLSKAGELTPVLFASAKTGAGIPELLDSVLRFLPEAGADPGTPLSGVVYKIEHDPVMGKAAHIRLFGGRLRNRDEVALSGGRAPEKITQIRRISGQKAEDIGALQSGEVGAVYGLSSAKTGDILGADVPFRRCSLAVPLLTVQVFAQNEAQLPALVAALTELTDEDPLLDLLWIREERQLHLKITGTIQLEVIAALLKARFGLEAHFSEPCVIYKETPAGKGVGFEAYTMPKPCWAVVELSVEPLPRGSGIVFESVIKERQLLCRYQNHVAQSIRDCVGQGVLGWEVTDAKITLTGGEHHTVHTHPLDFFVATPVAFLRALTDSGSTLLEPIVEVTLSGPESVLGKVIGDILHMRGAFDPPAIDREVFLLTARLPVATSLDYPVAFRSLTSGKGIYSSRFFGYRECPLELGRTAGRRGVDPLDRAKWILHCRSALSEKD